MGMKEQEEVIWERIDALETFNKTMEMCEGWTDFLADQGFPRILPHSFLRNNIYNRKLYKEQIKMNLLDEYTKKHYPSKADSEAGKQKERSGMESIL